MQVSRRALIKLETWLWTGPIGHLLGGCLDFAVALVRYRRSQGKRTGPTV